MKLSQINEATQHRITGGCDYLWNCWDNARFIEYGSDYADASVIMNTKTFEIYEASVAPKNEGKPYRWLNPKYSQLMIDESVSRGQDYTKAWDEVKWVDLDLTEDFLEKLKAIMDGEPFDDRVQIQLDLTDAEILRLALMAHERDITFNQMCVEILEIGLNLQSLKEHE